MPRKENVANVNARAAKESPDREAAAALIEGQQKGYIGRVPDETPNEAYTVAGVTSGMATPETSDEEGEGEGE